MLAYAAAVAAGLHTAACATMPASRNIACADAPAPRVEISSDGRTARTQLDVLTYNIEGLGWPARRGREDQLREIGRRLDDLRRAGDSPDVVLFQEVFSRPAAAAVESTGYPALAVGPGRRARRELPAAGRPPGRRAWTRGELGLRLTTGGLAIASLYPIAEMHGEPFNRRGCAGLDCLSNKGVLHARIAIPGAPVAVDVFNTHMNSRKASRAPRGRTLSAHAIQTAELEAFLRERRDYAGPAILGGDFNMRGSEARFEIFEQLLPMQLVHRYCVENPEGCRPEASWDGDAPWMDTQDLQLFAHGALASVRPLRVKSLFDGRPESPRLSDHDGLRVVYELAWRTSDAPPTASCMTGR